MSLARFNRSNFSRVALLVAAGAAVNACGGDPEGMSTAEFPAAPDLAAMRQDRPFNVLIVTLDTTRADHIGAYGASDADTPVIDALARGGVMFERAYSPVPLTLPAHTSLFTGTYPFDHGVRDNGSFIVPRS